MLSPSPAHVNGQNCLPRTGGWDVADLLAQAHAFGHEDATEGRDQQGSRYFVMGTPAWHSYNHGYAAGCAILALLTGVERPCWLPASSVSWNSARVN